MSELFDKVFIINLIQDKFKKKCMLKKLSETNLKNITFINAIDGRLEPFKSEYEKYRSKPFDYEGAHIYEKTRSKKMISSYGSYGYLHTWIKILNVSIENNYKKIIVFDDDVIFDKCFNKKFDIFFNQFKKFKIVSFGVSQHVWGNIITKNGYYNPIEFTDGSFALCIDCSIFKELLNETSKLNINFDSGPIRYIYKKYKSECYIIYPNIVIADLNTSTTSDSRNMIEYSNKFKWRLDNFHYSPYINILVSVIITTFNSEKTIELAIDSIINQTYLNIEIIVIDDCSTDNTLNILKKYSSIKLIELKQNMGCYYCKNIGIKLSKGNIICFHDSDDISTYDRIEIQVKELLEKKCDIVGANIIKCNKKILKTDLKNNRFKNIKPSFGMITLMFKKDIFDKNGYFYDYYDHSMDLEFIERLYFNIYNKISDINCHILLDKNKFPKYSKINKVLYLCNRSDSSITTRTSRGHKNFVREKYLKNIEILKGQTDTIFNLELIDFIKKNIGHINYNTNSKYNYLQYFTNNTNNKLEFDPKESNDNYSFFTKLNKDVKSKVYITDCKSIKKYFVDNNLNHLYFENKINYKQTKSESLNCLSFVFIIPSYNNEKYYKKNLDSILNQTYSNWKIFYIDDCSTDNTYNLVSKYIKDNNIQNKVELLKNPKNMKQAYSRFITYKKCRDNDVICFLDGDDWIYDNNVLEKIKEEYKKDIMLTYGSFYYYEDGKNNKFIESKPYDIKTIRTNSYRKKKGWYGIPLRTGYAKLYKNIPENYYKDFNNNWMEACTDVAEFLWAIEQTNGKFKEIKYPTYVYNIDASKRFSNSMYNLSKEKYKYRRRLANIIFNFKR